MSPSQTALMCLVVALGTNCAHRSEVSSKAVSVRAKATLRSFIEHIEGKNFEAAYALLSAPWRARYTPSRFQSDFEMEPLAAARLERAQHALKRQEPQFDGSRACFSMDSQHAVCLVLEADDFKLDRLE